MALLALGLVFAAAAVAQESPSARFEWFEYRGNDSVYRAFRPKPGEYVNPILAGFYPDPSITRAGDDYYLVTSSFAYFPGVPIFHSRDLVNWTQIGHVLDRPSQLPLDTVGTSRGIFAPAIAYHTPTRTFYVVTTHVDRGNFIVTATNPAGPWSDPIPLPDVDGIDPSIFFDDDGKAYIVNNGPPIGAPLYDGHRAVWMQEYDVAAKTTVGPRKLIVNGGVDISKRPIWIEGPHILEVNGRYYLICAEGGTADQHSEVVFRSDNVWGPYVPSRTNPILTQRHLDPNRAFPVTSTGHADFVQTPAGEWWAVFLGVRPYADDYHNIGRETFLLPVDWENGWPSILTGNATVPYTHAKPKLLPQPTPVVPTNGNFVVRDEFNGRTLDPSWVFLRTPRERWYELGGGALSIRARPIELSARQQPSFIARRQQHHWSEASTAVRFAAANPGDKAGIAAFQSDDYYYLLTVAHSGGDRGPVVQLEKRAGPLTNGATIVVASAPLAIDSSQPVRLRIVARGPKYDFYYGTGTTGWKTLEGAEGLDGTILSTRVAGGFSSAFVGTTFGLFAFAR